MNAKFDVDEKLNITGKVVEINATDEGIVYQLKVKTVNGSVMMNIEEDELEKKSESDSSNVEPNVDPEPTPEPTPDTDPDNQNDGGNDGI